MFRNHVKNSCTCLNSCSFRDLNLLFCIQVYIAPHIDHRPILSSFLQACVVFLYVGLQVFLFQIFHLCKKACVIYKSFVTQYSEMLTVVHNLIFAIFRRVVTIHELILTKYTELLRRKMGLLFRVEPSTSHIRMHNRLFTLYSR